MSFDESIDFSKYGINFDCVPDTKIVPETIKENILPVVSADGVAIFTKSDGEQIKMKYGQKLGAGSYGAAWTTDTELDKGTKLIIKVIDTTWIKKTDALSNFVYDVVKEALTQIIIYECTKDIKLPEINLVGPFAPKLYLIGKDDSNIYIVSEMLDGGLDSVLIQPNIPSSEFMKTSITHLAKILGILYEKLKFNHRDLKADNVMYKNIDGKMNVRLIDFGFSCLTYRQLYLTPTSKEVYGSHLHCNSKIRDMHSYLYYLINHSVYAFITCPIKTLIEALIVTDKKLPTSWKNSYNNFDTFNAVGNSAAALNCSYDVVYNIFSTLKFGNSDSCSAFNNDWTKHLVKLYFDTDRQLSDNEFEYVKPDVKRVYLKGFLLNNLKRFWVNNGSKNMFISEFKFNRYEDASRGKLHSAPVELLPQLLEAFMTSKEGLIYLSDQLGETFLHKIVRNKDKPNMNEYFDWFMKAFNDNKDLINKMSKNNEYAYTIALENKYTYAVERLEKYLDRKILIMPFVMRTLVEPDNKYLAENLKACVIVLETAIESKNNSILDSLLNKLNKTILDKMLVISYDYINRMDISITPMDLAIDKLNIHAIEKLMPYNLSILRKDKFIFKVSMINDGDLVTALIDRYFTPDNINIIDPQFHATPLMFAVSLNNILVVRKLVSVPNIIFSKQDKDGKTCLHYAVKNALTISDSGKKVAFDIIKILLDAYPALADIKDFYGEGPANPKAAPSNIRQYIKSRKSTFFKKNPNTEKNLRGGLRRRKRNTRRL